MKRMKRWFLAACAVMAIALGSAGPSMAAAQTVLRTDVGATLSNSSNINLSINGQTTPIKLSSSAVGLHSDAPFCVVSHPGQPACNAFLNIISMQLQTFTITNSVGTFTIANPTVVMRGPIAIKNQGSGFSIPAGTNTSFSGSLSGTFSDGSPVPFTSVLTTQPTPSATTLQLSIPTQDLSITGTFPFSVSLAGRTVQGSVNVAAVANKPFLNVPPIARAGDDQTVSCGQIVTLNGSQSTDGNNNINSFTWLRNGVVIGQGPTISVSVPLGTAVFTLQVRDTFSGLGVDTVVVTSLLGDAASCCPQGTNVILGTSNNDTLNGTSGADCILGFGGQDTINGGGGNDIISGGAGDDIINGGTGDDLISGGDGQDRLFGQDGNDTLSGDGGDDRVEGGNGNDTLLGGQGQDQLICGPGDDQAFGGSGDDRLEGGLNNDVLDGGPDNDTCISGGGTDQFISCANVQ